MANKQKYLDMFLRIFRDLESITSEYDYVLKKLVQVVEDFAAEEYIAPPSRKNTLFEHPGMDGPWPERESTNIPPELETALALLRSEIDARRAAVGAHRELLASFRQQIDRGFAASQECESCGRIFAKSYLKRLDPPNDHILICEGCFDDQFFDCHKCKRILPMAEYGEDDDYAGYGGFCKECCKPMGFPKQVVIAPEFQGCENVAAASLEDLRSYTFRSTGWNEPDASDAITVKFVGYRDGRLGKYGIYRSENGLQCEVGELNWRGIGSLYINEERDEEEEDDE